jgi:hypothetical protein
MRDPRLRSSRARRSYDEDRRDAKNRSPFLSIRAIRLHERIHVREQAPVRARSSDDQASDLIDRRSRASLSPRAFCRLLHYLAMHGHLPLAETGSSFCAEGDEPSGAFAFRCTPRGVRLADEPISGPETTGGKARSVFRRGESPSRIDSAHLVRRERDEERRKMLSFSHSPERVSTRDARGTRS